MTAAPFTPFGPSHWLALGGTAAVWLLLWWLASSGRTSARRSAEGILAALLFLIWPVGVAVRWQHDSLSWANGLPFHYCDVAALACAVALLRQRPSWMEFGYFFGLAGTLQGLLTPSIPLDYPDPRYFHFFIWHGGVVVASLHFVTGIRWRPRAGAWWRMMVATAVWAAATALINLLSGGNYGFLCAKPSTASIMDPLGPWPWYIASLGVVAGVVYALLLLPFRLGSGRTKTQSRGVPPLSSERSSK